MCTGKINISTEVQKTMALPMRSQKPKDLNQIRHCVAFNVVVVRDSYFIAIFCVSNDKLGCLLVELFVFREREISF